MCSQGRIQSYLDRKAFEVLFKIHVPVYYIITFIFQFDGYFCLTGILFLHIMR